MFQIGCPWCGPREQVEFKAGGEAHIHRPANPAALSDEAWADYLFMRKNPKGVHHERWVHAHGCRKWFHIARNTATDQILAVYPVTDPIPAIDGDRPATPCGDVGGSGNTPLDQPQGEALEFAGIATKGAGG